MTDGYTWAYGIPYSIHNWIPDPIWKLPFQKLPSKNPNSTEPTGFHPPTGFPPRHIVVSEVFNIASVAYGISHVGSLRPRGRCGVSNTGPRLEHGLTKLVVFRLGGWVGLGWLG